MQAGPIRYLTPVPHSAGAAVWRRLGRTGEQTLTAVLDNPDGDALYRRQQAAQAEAEDERRRAAEREARRPVCKRCGQKLTDQRWEEATARDASSVCGSCHADDVARREAAAEAGRRSRPTTTTRCRANPDSASSAGGPDRVPPVSRGQRARPRWTRATTVRATSAADRYQPNEEGL
jgi:hypothetical protein